MSELAFGPTYTFFHRRIFILLVLATISISSSSQNKLDSLLGKLDPQKFAAKIQDRASRLEDRITKKSMKVLSSLQKQEEKVYMKMLSGKDSLMAKAKLQEVKEKYEGLKSKLKDPLAKVSGSKYIPRLDSFTTSLKFLDQNGIGGKVKDALAKTNQLQDKFQQAEQIKQFIKERREQLKQAFEKLGMVKQLKQLNKQVYYYAAQVKEYKEMFKDPKKIERKALELLSKTKLFQDFFKKNSLFASLFRMPGDPNDPAYLASLSGLQTRSQVNALVENLVASGGPNAQAALTQNLQGAQSQIRDLQSRVMKMGGGSSDDIMPQGFKPNDQKTKSFLKRIEYSTNMQSQKNTQYFPATSDIGLSAGYKLNEKSIIGLGASFKLGWGNGWQHIKITGQGVGLRSFVDWKIKGQFWVSGGFEMNFKSEYHRLVQLQDLNSWQQSGLLGISKSIPVKTKFFKKTKLQLLWDFLSYQQVPRTQPILFRVGYNFK